MPKKARVGKRITVHPNATPERLVEHKRKAAVENAYFESPAGQAELESIRKSRGGARKGAGKKPQYDAAKIKTSAAFSQEVYEYGKQHELSLSQLAENLIRKSKEFREWQKKKNSK